MGGERGEEAAALLVLRRHRGLYLFFKRESCLHMAFPLQKGCARCAYLTFPGVYGAPGWLARTDGSVVGTENRKSGIVRVR